VARIAYLASDVIVSVQPAQAIESEFSSHLHRYSGRKDRSLVAATGDGVPEVCYCACPGVPNVNTIV
jgi:sulfite reductase (NADPH) hemoprotein beta-component